MGYLGKPVSLNSKDIKLLVNLDENKIIKADISLLSLNEEVKLKLSEKDFGLKQRKDSVIRPIWHYIRNQKYPTEIELKNLSHESKLLLKQRKFSAIENDALVRKTKKW